MSSKKNWGVLICKALYALHRGTNKEEVSYAKAFPVALEVLGIPAIEGQSPRAYIRRHEKSLLKYIEAHKQRLFEIAADVNDVKPPRIKKKKRVNAQHKAPVKYVGPPVSSDDFLSTFEWRRVRMMALKKYGPRCQCCGATPADGAVMNVDHIKPRKLFPHLALNVNNLQILCHECNHGKGNWDMTDWRNPAAAELPLDPNDLNHIRDIAKGD